MVRLVSSYYPFERVGMRLSHIISLFISSADLVKFPWRNGIVILRMAVCCKTRLVTRGRTGDNIRDNTNNGDAPGLGRILSNRLL